MAGLGAGSGAGWRSRVLDVELDVKASLVAVLLVVVDILSVHLALDSQLRVPGQVGELQRH